VARYSSHAERRMRERNISKTEVEQTLAHPLEIVETRYGRKAACRRVDSGYCLVVIFEGMAEELIVVTALKVNTERVRRYGFTRV
jgi:hypothetical protein